MSDAPALVRRLRSGSRVAQLQALRSLASLASNSPEARQQAVAAGGVAAVLQLSGQSGGGGAVQEAAARALAALSEEPDAATLAALLSAGAVPVLVSILRRSLDSGDLALQPTVAGTLWGLSACPGGGAAVAAGGAIPLLVQLLLPCQGHATTPATIMYAAGALYCIAAAGAEQFAAAIVAYGGVPALLALIERRTPASAASQTELEALVYAAGVLERLAEHDAECQAAVVAAGGVACLASLLSHSSDRVQLAAASALPAVLDSCTAAQAAFAEAQAAPAAVHLLSHPSPRVQTNAAGMLGTAACSHAANSAAILAAGAMQPLAQLLRTPGHPGHEWAATTVSNLCAMQPEAATAAVQQAGGVLDALGQIAATSNDEAARQAAATALQHLADAAATAAQQQPGSGGSQPSASPADSAVANDSEAAGPAAAKPARVCTAPGCGATRRLKRCGGCGTVRYCSTACSRAHWQAHKAECRRLQAERAAAAAGAAEVPNA